MSRAMFLTALAGYFLALPAGHAAEPDSPAATWQRIAPYFKPPAEYADKLGSFRSPLLFDDGTRVRTAGDWPRRRQEILSAWTKLMGPWPAVIDKPKVEVLQRSRRENFTQLRIRLEIAAEQTG